MFRFNGSLAALWPARAIASATLVAVVLASSPVRADSLSPTMEHARAVASAKVAATHASVPAGSYPAYTATGGSWALQKPRNWVSGFLPGSLWYEYQRTGAASWKKAAETRGVAIRPFARDTGFMDIGFMFLGSDGHDWRLTGDLAAHDRLLAAARSLLVRYNPTVQLVCTRRTADGYQVIVDTLMNNELLFWGASHGGGRAMREAATNHALRTIRDFMRPDGSCFQYVTYNERAGTVLQKGQIQGYDDNTTWSRGQAWMIYGLAVAYRETGDARFLQGASRAARYWIDHVPADLVPYWDFGAPGIPDEPRDSSAAAVVASAFIELGTIDPDDARRAEYLDTARRTLESLSSPMYLSEVSAFKAVLAHGTFSVPLGAYDQGTAWGDYYFAQALARLRTQVVRLAGPDRYATAVRVSQVDFPSAEAVIVVSGELYPDALAASGLAGVLEAPVLLTRATSLPGGVAEEIRRLGASRVVVVGGTPSVGRAVESALRALPGVHVERIAGPDRYATAAAVAARVARNLGAGYSGEAFLVRGDGFADGLSVSALAYSGRMPVLLTRQSVLPDVAAAFLASSETTRVIVAGGESAVAGAVEASLKTRYRLTTLRLAGPDRYRTALSLADWALREGRAGRGFFVLSTGQGWPDALAGGPAAGKHAGLLLLTRQAHLPSEVAGFLARHSSEPTAVQVLGGDSAVSGVAENELRTALPEQ